MASELPPPFIAVTDKKWFDFLSSRADRGRLDEVNFWSPKSSRPTAPKKHTGAPRRAAATA